MKLLKNTLKYLLFLFFGLSIIWFIYKDVDKENLLKGLRETNYFWIALSVILGLVSHYVRAVRWNMLINSMGYKPKTYNTFFSVLFMYFINMIIPRAGELARCTILSRYEKIPVSKLIGTVIVERIADFITMMGLAILVFAINIGVVHEFFTMHPEVGAKLAKLLSVPNILLGIIALALIIGAFVFLKPFKRGKIGAKFHKLKYEFQDGIKSILMLENRWWFIGQTLLIFFIWFLMLYVVFLAYPPTRHLTIWVGMFTFLMGGLAMLAPVQGGIGPWHYMVMEALFLFGIDKGSGKFFALIAHSSTSLVYLILGSLAGLLMYLINRTHKQHVEVDIK
ncbi:MAG: lysylphosphatidylglycerol synthase transmembrane domain-containing protein [Bacteroidota bacterium]|nr:lysylphosphatidylglycerol synthase transmembrane domain-containing protein [Bacteroidota bacterium]